MRQPPEVTETADDGPNLFAVSDLHVAHPENRDVVADALHPSSAADWLIVAGDVAEVMTDIEWALGLLAERFARVIWAPGNHELWTVRDDPDQRRGLRRYRTGAVCTDEFLLHPDPFISVDDWCAARVRSTEERLAACGRGVPLVLVNHFPLVREPTRVLRHPEFAQWCGTERTSDWHLRFPVEVVVYGHLHIPATHSYDGVRFEEVSLGYPRERRSRRRPHGPMRRILPRTGVV